MTKTTESDKPMTAGAAAMYLAGIILLPAWIAWQGFCLMALWNWFAPAPLARLTFGAACGLDILIVLARGTRHADTTPERETGGAAVLRLFGRQLLFPGLVLFLGYVVHLIVAGAAQ